jgi:hypothetical protein
VTTIADVQAALAQAEADRNALSLAVSDVSGDAAALLGDLNVIAADLAALTPTPPPPPPTTMPAPPGYTHLWLEETFPGPALDRTKWNPWYGPGVRWDVKNLGAPYSSGGSNQAAYWSPAQITLNNGLALTARRTVPGDVGYGKLPWVSGCITTAQPLPSTGCYVQVKARRCDSASGMWPADWLLPNSSEQELDGYEGGWPGANPNQQGHSDTFFGSGQVQAVWQAGVDLTAADHVYGYQFIPGNPGTFSTYFDGKLVRPSTGALSPEAYYLFLQLQVYSGGSGQWHTEVTGATPNPSLSLYSEVQIWTP